MPQAFGGPDLIFAAYAYAAQIYCDFSGYTDIAIGLALLMGFIFPQNFRSPYRALGFRDFWRRWHMTLSRFLRDYLYIPLGGNRKGKVRTYVNLFLTMVLGGLWHGASWTFVLWGAFHGTGLSAEHALGRPGRAGAGLAALVHHLQPRRLRLDPLPLARPRPLLDLRRPACSSRRPATLVTVPAVLALLAVIGLQLVPERDSQGFEVADRADLAGRARRRPRRAYPDRRRDRAQPGRAALHLLQLLMPTEPPQRRQPDGALRRREAAPLQRPRRGRSRPC